MDGKDISTPRFFSLLSSSDQRDYLSLKDSLASTGVRNRRGKRLESFAEYLSSIKKFCVRGDEDDWKRCLVCGVCWVTTGSLAINTRQLRLLIDKCKSSINGSLHKMGYSTSSSCRGDASSSLIDRLPILKGNFSELRQWTVRQQTVATPQPSADVDDAIKQIIVKPATPEASFVDNFELDFARPLYNEDVGIDNKFFDDPICLPMTSWLEFQDSKDSNSLLQQKDDIPFDLPII